MNSVEPIRDKSKIEEVKSILMRQSYRDWFLFLMGINTGLRISDLLQLRVRDVRDKTHIRIREKKTQKEKKFLINAELQAHIREYTIGMDDEEFLFPSRKGRQAIKRVQAYKILNQAARKAGLKDPIGTHTLRKTFGYHFYQVKLDVAILQQIFNHSSPSITKRYIGISQDEIDKAVEDFSL